MRSDANPMDVLPRDVLPRVVVTLRCPMTGYELYTDYSAQCLSNCDKGWTDGSYHPLVRWKYKCVTDTCPAAFPTMCELYDNDDDSEEMLVSRVCVAQGVACSNVPPDAATEWQRCVVA